MTQGEHEAIQFHQYGGSEVLKLEKVSLPVINDDEVLIKIKYTGVNPIDWKLREGLRSVPLPFIPGVEASGIIAVVGKNVQGLQPGQAVYGAIDHSYAKYAKAKAEMLFPLPAHLSFEEGAAVGGGKTAWGALFEIAKLRKGQRILIHGASGGVGLFAVQLAHQAGAHVIVTAAEKNAAMLRDLGASEIIDYHKENFEEQSGKVDVVLDGVGGDLLKRSYGVVKENGMLTSIVEQPSQELAANYRIKALWGGTKNLAAMVEINRRLQEQSLQPIISKIFHTLSQAALAQDYSKMGEKNMGKIVLEVS